MTIYSDLPASDSDLAANGYAVVKFNLRGATAGGYRLGKRATGFAFQPGRAAGVRQPSGIRSERARANLPGWGGRGAGRRNQSSARA